MRNKKKLTGILFILAGLGLVANRLGYLQGINVFSMVITGYLIYIIIKSIAKVNIGGILVPLSLIGVIFWDYIGIQSFNPWTFVWASLLVSIGISLIFKPKKKYGIFGRFRSDNAYSYQEKDGRILIESTFSECIRYLQGEDIESVKLESSFGSMKIYFDKLQVKNNELFVEIESAFSGIELYLPRDWEVINKVDAIFGAVNEKNRNSGEKTNTIFLHGDTTFSGVEIIYI